MNSIVTLFYETTKTKTMGIYSILHEDCKKLNYLGFG